MRSIFFVLFTAILLFSCSNGKNLLEAEELFETGNYQAAVESYSEYIRLHPSETKAIYNRGRSYEELGEIDNAIQDFQKVLEIDKEHVQANISMGMYYYFQLQDFAECIEYMNTALGGEKKDAKAYTLRGKAYQRLGDVKQAMKDYNNAISEDKDYADAYYARASLKIYMQRNADACADFQIAMSLGLEEARKAIDSYCK